MSSESLVLFFIVGVVLVGGAVLFSHFVAPSFSKSPAKFEPYECGMDPYGSAWETRFSISYYLYALIFLAFDVDILYLFPVAAAYNGVSGLRGFVEIFIFIAILSLAIIYAWAKGVFSWAKRRESY